MLVATGSPAFAQTTSTACGQAGYPGCSSSTTTGSNSSVQNEGTVRSGQTKTFESCGYQPGSTVNVSFNGQPAGTTTADSSGCVHVQVAALGQCRSVTVNGVAFTAKPGRNDVVAAGTGSNGASRTTDFFFSVNCGQGTARTGTNVARWSMFGGILVLAGAAVVVAARQRRSTKA
jgi:hypothetical protein